ncbi:hypothetical protein PGTUg99_035518 [Puccinia graminis f. sp. tritici]|uniref:Uncharacterized protein n=1 Tax=Puccinia graminis f. sp. tritici TaxID=56615 RepID=A0A5B0R958_PUCGR|nr:hypothetical protein PGTUg99_035518 [Puccinia graminis f. sp. tritici]
MQTNSNRSKIGDTDPTTSSVEKPPPVHTSNLPIEARCETYKEILSNVPIIAVEELTVTGANLFDTATSGKDPNSLVLKGVGTLGNYK